MLEQQYLQKQFEVVNAAMRGINSHVVLPIARDCADLSPSLFLVYMGNNEAVGLYAPGPKGFNATPYRRLLRCSQSLKGTRLAQAMQRLARRVLKPASKPEQDIEFFRAHRLQADDPRRTAIYDNFQANLDDVCGAARRAGAPVILSTVAVNLGGFPPVASLHRSGLTPAQIESWQAEYARGAINETQGRFAEARQSFALARDWDALQFRTDRRLNL